MVAVWLGPLWPPHSWSPSSRVDSGSVTCFTSDHQKNSFLHAMSCMLRMVSTALLLAFFRQNVSSFSYSFGILLPGIVDCFNVGRAEAGLTYSLMIFLTDASGRHYCAIDEVAFFSPISIFDKQPTPLKKRRKKRQSYCNVLKASVAKNTPRIPFIIFLWLIFSLSQDHWLQPC